MSDSINNVTYEIKGLFSEENSRISFAEEGNVFSERIVIRIVNAVLKSFSHSFTPDAVVHIPDAVLDAIYQHSDYYNTLSTGEFCLLKSGDNEGDNSSIEVLATFEDPRKFENQLLIFFHGQVMNMLILGSKINSDNETEEQWRINACFTTNEISKFLDQIIVNFQEHPEALTLRSLLSQNLKNIEIASENLNNKSIENWGKFFFDLLVQSAGASFEDESELAWYQMVTRLQDAVGWELDLERMTKAMSIVLNEAVEHDYLELQSLTKTKGKWSINSNFQVNKTELGSKMVTLLLKTDKREELLKNAKPVLLRGSNIESWFANPNLTRYLGLRSGILVPLLHKNEAIGILKLLSVKPNSFSYKDTNKMEAFGRIIARSMLNINTYYAMRKLAMVDSLTNIYNRRFFNEQITREFIRAKRYKHKLCLIMLDIDHFKNYNDTNGHLMGDRVLAETATILKNSVRESDVVTRYGGEEFAIILPETTLNKGKLVAEKIRHAVETHDFPHGEKQPLGMVTVSLGIAEISEETTDINYLIANADSALYEAKNSGRNRCSIFGETTKG